MKKLSKSYTCYGMCYYDYTPLSNMVDNTRDKYIILALASYIICICSFDLQMSQVGYNAFAMVISFVNSSWDPPMLWIFKCIA
jgi:hypothetical protein